jgi:hypothetical protein
MEELLIIKLLKISNICLKQPKNEFINRSKL